MLQEMGENRRNSALARKELQVFVDSFPSLEELEPSEAEGEAFPDDEQPDTCPPVLFDELINYMKGSLAAMKSFAILSRDAFKDAELGGHYYNIISEDIERTMSVLDCYCSYLRFNNPARKKGTIQTLMEGTLNVHEKQLKDKNITIINKQFEKDLPEAMMPDAQLRYVLDTIIQYSLLSLPHYSSLGFLTRLYDHSGGNGQEQGGLQKDRQYIEILVVSSHREKSKGFSAGVGAGNNGAGTELMLELVEEVIGKNQGGMKLKSYDQKEMSFISLILPVDRRKVLQFPSPNTLYEKLDR